MVKTFDPRNIVIFRSLKPEQDIRIVYVRNIEIVCSSEGLWGGVKSVEGWMLLPRTGSDIKDTP